MSLDLEEGRARLLGQLQKAVTLELSTLPPYLTAMWSLRPGSNQPAAALIRSVLMEEMLHMTQAANVMSALGGSVQLGGDALPYYPLPLEFDGRSEGSRVVHIHLERFSRSAIRTFMQIELPENLPAPPGSVPAPELAIPDFSIGQFYGEIEDGLRALSETFGDAAVFIGDPRRQISEEFYWKGGGQPIVVNGLARALEALDVITAQGEGADGTLFDGDRHFFGQPDEIAHYFRFAQLLAGRLYAPGDSIHGPPTGPELPVDFDAVVPIKTDCRQADFAHDAALAALNAKFNALYSMMLWQLAEGFAGNPPVFYTAIMNGMHGLGEIARTLVAMRIPGDPERRHASPTFEWNPAGLGLQTARVKGTP